MGSASRDKGARGERELARFLTEEGWPSERGIQRSGSPDSPDVKGVLSRAFHIECKRTESLSVFKALDQAKRDAGGLRIPVVYHRRNNCRWVVVIGEDDYLTLMGSSSWLKDLYNHGLVARHDVEGSLRLIAALEHATLTKNLLGQTLGVVFHRRGSRRCRILWATDFHQIVRESDILDPR